MDRVNLDLVLVKADDWEGLYKHCVLIDQGHSLNEGEERVLYFAKLAEEFDFNLKDLQVIYLNQEQERQLEENGSLEQNFYDICGMYEKYKIWRD